MNNFFILITNGSVDNRVIASIVVFIISLFCLKEGFKSLYYKRKGDKVNAVITRIEAKLRLASDRKRRHVYVDYEYNGQFYPNILLGFYNSSFRKGKKLTLYVFPDKPNKPEHSDFIILLPIGLGLIAYAIGLLISAIL